MSTQKIVSVLSLFALVNLSTQKVNANTVVGAAVGAAVGSAIGQQSNGRDGALVGGALGGLIGASVGNDLEGRRGGGESRSGNRPDYGRDDDRDDEDYRGGHDNRRPRYAPPPEHHHHYYGYHPRYRKYKHWKRPVIIRESRRNHYDLHYAYR